MGRGEVHSRQDLVAMRSRGPYVYDEHHRRTIPVMTSLTVQYWRHTRQLVAHSPEDWLVECSFLTLEMTLRDEAGREPSEIPLSFHFPLRLQTCT